MAWFVISYDLRKQRNYQGLYDGLATWKAIPLLESMWLAELVGPASTVRDLLRSFVDDDDGIAVLELKAGFDWGAVKCSPAGMAWLKARSP